MRLAFALILILRAASAQALPDGQALSDRLGTVWKSLHSAEFDGEVTMETAFPGAPPIKVVSQMSAAFMLPGRTRVESKAGGVTILNVSDGETTWIYNSMKKQYVRLEAAQGPQAVMASMGVKMPDPASIHSSYKTTGQETIEIDGQKHDCWIVEMQMGEISIPGAAGQEPAKMTGALMTMWIDKKLGIDLQSTMAMTMHVAGKDMAMHQKTVKKNLKVDEALPESLFVFTPPEDAKQVQDMMLFGGPAGKPELAGKAAPAFELKSLDGKTFSLASLKGKPVLLDFWATWCVPCRKSMPALEKISRQYKDTDLVILGVNSGEERDIVEKFLKTTPFEYPAVLSGDSGILDSYEVSAYPTFILIGRDGKIIANDIGVRDDDQFREMIAKAGLAPKKE